MIYAFQNIEKVKTTLSMSGVGCPDDNACAESFFSLLKKERISRERPKAIRAAAEQADEYIRFYTCDRIQFTVKMTPWKTRTGSAAQQASAKMSA